MATQYPNYSPGEGACVVQRDGETVSPVLENGDAAFGWLLRHQGQSVSYALTYGGYNVVVATADTTTQEG